MVRVSSRGTLLAARGAMSEQLANAAAGHGVRLAVEAVSVQTCLPADLDGPHPVASTLPQLAELLHDTRAEGVGVLVDSFHWATAGADPAHITGLSPGAITHVPVADAPADLAEGYAGQSDWDPRTSPDGYAYLVLRPERVQAWREVNELAGRTLMRDGTWTV